MPKEPARPAPEDCTTKTEGSGDLSLCLRTYNFSIFKYIVGRASPTFHVKFLASCFFETRTETRLSCGKRLIWTSGTLFARLALDALQYLDYINDLYRNLYSIDSQRKTTFQNMVQIRRKNRLQLLTSTASRLNFKNGKNCLCRSRQ